MKLSVKHLIIPCLLLLCYTSCDRPECVNERLIFNQYKYTDIEYKRELARLIDSIGIDNFDYWIKRYHKDGDRDYMDFYIQSANVCAIGVLDITGAERLSQYIGVGGMSYAGAGLSGLKYTIEQTDTSVDFIFNDVSWIQD